MLTIKQVIRDREPYSIHETASVLEAAEYMAERKIGGVCVLDDEGNLVGILTERDLLNRIIVPRTDPASTPVREIMSRIRAVIRCDETPHDALERMEQIESRHLPVVEGEKWVGMLSIRDLLRVEVNEKGDEIKFLHDYISH